MSTPTARLAATGDGIARAAGMLRQGGLVAFGTETVYGLGADATDAVAVAGIFAAKARPRFNPLICHYPSAAAAFADVAAGPVATRLAARFWPGPLTLILERRATSKVALLAAAGLPSLAVRVPGHAVARALLAAVGRPVAAPSANRSGRVSPTSALDVLAELDGRIDAVLDCGTCPVGVESTVLDLTGPAPVLLRPGGVTAEALEAVLGPLAQGAPVAGPDAVRAPGQLASHYAPRLPVRLGARRVGADEALLAFGPPLPGAGAVYQLSEAGDVTEAAARLFAGLRVLGGSGLARIAVMAVPSVGLGVAINDRLGRAAAAREG